ELVRREVERGTLHLSTDISALASAMVRIAEAAVYADMLAGATPDIEPSVEIVAMLLAPADGQR
ncbi:MAG TPA: QsdR family transcriptional regulator, partial [Acidimicrobiales bacterium]